MEFELDIKYAIRITLGIWGLCALVMVGYWLFVPGVDTGDIFALGQLFLEFSLIPVAVFGFWYAVQEFSKNQRRPLLFLGWADGKSSGKNLVLEQSRSDFNINSTNTPGILKQGIVLKNDGDNVATWFSIRLEFPDELFAKGAPDYWDSGTLSLMGFKYEHNGEEHWSQDIAPTYRSETFQSNGILASYPRQDLPLGSLWFIPIPNGEDGIQKFSIKYAIYTDVGIQTVRKLELQINWTD